LCSADFECRKFSRPCRMMLYWFLLLVFLTFFSAQKAGYSFAFTAYSALKSCPHQSSQMPSHGVLRLRVVLSRPLPQIVRHGPHKARILPDVKQNISQKD
ncbi:hypothetical protein AALA61_15875, partial [Oscillospiraceae bacterium 42-9]